MTGRFFASAPKKLTGPLHEVALDHIRDRAGQAAAWRVTARLSGADVPAALNRREGGDR